MEKGNVKTQLKFWKRQMPHTRKMDKAATRCVSVGKIHHNLETSTEEICL